VSPDARASLVVFDLDGTLADTKQDLCAAVNHVRGVHGLAPLAESDIARMIGDGARALVERALGDQPADAAIEAGLELFLTYYREHMLDRTTLYPGVVEALDRLSSSTLAVLTNKPFRFSRHLLDGLGILDRFVAVYGGNSFDRKKPDPVGLLRILEETGIDRGATWMVGDSAVDVRTGRAAGVRTCGVKYGYGSAGFERYPPDIIVESIHDIVFHVEARQVTSGRGR